MAFSAGYRLGLILDPDGTIRSVNEVSGIGHFASEALVGKFVGDAAAGGVRGAPRRQVWRDRVAAAHTSQEPARYWDLRPDALDGSAAVILTTVTPVLLSDGTLQAILVAVQDRSEVVELERTAFEQRELLNSALQVTGMGSFAYYVREQRFECDDRYREIFGAPPAVAERGSGALMERIHEDDRSRVLQEFQSALVGSEGVSYQQEYRIWAERPSGPQLRRIATVARVEVDAQGPRRILGVVDDVTERRREEELRIRMQKREALGTLAGGMAHDFNNVISAILSNASVASAEVKAGVDPSTSIDEISRGAKRAGDLVRRMLDFSRDREPERRAFSLAAVANDACSLLQPTLPRGSSLTFDASEDLPDLLGDASQIHQVVVNLVSNAAQAFNHGPAGTIGVSVDALAITPRKAGVPTDLGPGTYVRLRVTDDGRGIAEHELPRIFDPFFTTKVRGEGTGLGLAAAQSIVRSHGGQITVDSIVGTGTTVTVLLPTSSEVEQPKDQAPQVPRGQSAAPGPTAAPRVLFVDDEPSLASLAARALPHHGLVVTAFTEPTQALQALTDDPTAFDVLVTDLAMPVLTGFELVVRLRALRPDLPVVLTSGFLTDESHAEAERLGIDRVVPKPCPVDALARAVLAVTRSS
ncbi:MAG: response regulator [Solirubrobacteraceae bacterium]|nr:response regulator [Solirubrobacteraceae bacterium]